jgi:hypothetical protein
LVAVMIIITAAIWIIEEGIGQSNK